MPSRHKGTTNDMQNNRGKCDYQNGLIITSPFYMSTVMLHIDQE